MPAESKPGFDILGIDYMFMEAIVAASDLIQGQNLPDVHFRVPFIDLVKLEDAVRPFRAGG